MKDIVLGGNVYWLIGELCDERLPAINLLHVDLARGGECPAEQHLAEVSADGSTACVLIIRFELLVQSVDRIGGPRAPPLARRQSCEGEKLVAGFLQAVGDGAVLEPLLRMKALQRASISSRVAA
jgi:hypothetical protein